MSADENDDLFSEFALRGAPLPHRLRPGNWDAYVGQSDVLRVLRGRAPHSMILYGPPGSGKTTLARLLARDADAEFRALSAVSAGVKDVRAVIETGKTNASMGRKTILFIDEIHRFSKSQQDALLEAVESGWVLLIGATTENPSFEIIRPLLSRCQVYRLRELSKEDLESILTRALTSDPVLKDLRLEERARELLIESAGGDARKLLRILETALPADNASSAGKGADAASRVISTERLREATQNLLRNYDKAGDNHYDFISAFIKSLRGSDPDAALLYMACMIEAGEDPLFIARRMIIFAAEDVGNASPQALSLAVSASQAVERIGMPEGRIVLAQACSFLASCPKSNSSYAAINRALEAVRGRSVSVPNHLRNAPTATHQTEGAGKGYKYPHDFPGGYADQNYLPEGFENAHFYFPSDRGQEARLRERLRELRPERDYGTTREPE